MAEVPRQAEDLEAWIALPGLDHQLVAPVGAPVVDEDHLGAAVELAEQALEPAQQLRECLLLVVDRDDDREFGAHLIH